MASDLAPSDSQALRAYFSSLEDFCRHARQANDKTRGTKKHREERERLLQAIKERRQPAFVAGVRAGRSPENMEKVLLVCFHHCFEHKREFEEYGEAAHATMVGRLVRHMQAIDDMISLVEANKNDNGAARPGTSRPQATSTLTKPKTGVNGRMLGSLQQGNLDCKGWTVKRWAVHLKCAKSSVVETQTWKSLAEFRDELKVTKQTERRRAINELNGTC